MRHSNGYRKLKRDASQRRSLLRNLATSLVEHEAIKTTEAKAKELRTYVEKLITMGRKKTLAARRNVESCLFGEIAAKKLCDELVPRFDGRPGGYTRIIKQGKRNGDKAPVCQISFVDLVFKEKEVAAAPENSTKAPV